MTTLIPTRVPATPIARAVGDEMPTGTAGPMTRTDFVRYAGAGGDFHPLHHDEPYAQKFGMPSVFGMGLQPASHRSCRPGRRTSIRTTRPEVSSSKSTGCASRRPLSTRS
jgi:hypothetical protein